MDLPTSDRSQREAELVQLGTDRRLAGECRGVALGQRIPAQALGQRQRAHRYPGKRWTGSVSAACRSNHASRPDASVV